MLTSEERGGCSTATSSSSAMGRCSAVSVSSGHGPAWLPSYLRFFLGAILRQRPIGCDKQPANVCHPRIWVERKHELTTSSKTPSFLCSGVSAGSRSGPSDDWFPHRPVPPTYESQEQPLMLDKLRLNGSRRRDQIAEPVDGLVRLDGHPFGCAGSLGLTLEYFLHQLRATPFEVEGRSAF